MTEKIDTNEIYCPTSKKAQIVIASWGDKKRQRYSELVKNYGMGVELAYYCVEYNQGLTRLQSKRTKEKEN